MNGILLIDKSKNWTSFDVVAKVRGICSQIEGKRVKVGHAGTLDPLATGLLIIMIGSFTKRADEFMKKDKTYEVKLKLGFSSSTDDSEGEITAKSDNKPTSKELNKVLDEFQGEILQTPPAFSAIKINGQRAYKLARQGKEVKIQPRKVKIYSIKDVEYDYPQVSFTADVSSGTYIRSLVRDIGDKLGISAYMNDLRRTSIDDYSVDSALFVEKLDPESIKKYMFFP